MSLPELLRYFAERVTPLIYWICIPKSMMLA
jgi:hypothetical protein